MISAEVETSLAGPCEEQEEVIITAAPMPWKAVNRAPIVSLAGIVNILYGYLTFFR